MSKSAIQPWLTASWTDWCITLTASKCGATPCAKARAPSRRAEMARFCGSIHPPSHRFYFKLGALGREIRGQSSLSDHIGMGWRNLFLQKAKASIPNTAPQILDTYDRRHPQQGDQLILKRLEELGADLSLPREVVHFLFVPNAEHARQVAITLRNDGYDVEEKPASTTSDSNQWAVVSRTEAVVNKEAVEIERLRFEELAKMHGGDYDGWEAAAEP